MLLPSMGHLGYAGYMHSTWVSETINPVVPHVSWFQEEQGAEEIRWQVWGADSALVTYHTANGVELEGSVSFKMLYGCRGISMLKELSTNHLDFATKLYIFCRCFLFLYCEGEFQITEFAIF